MIRNLLIVLLIAVILYVVVHILSLILGGWLIFTILRFLIVIAFVAVVIVLCINYRKKH